MASTLIRIIFLLTIAPITTIARENQVADSQPACLPFNALFVRHTSSGYDVSFIQQTRLIITLIHDFPESTNISLVTVGAEMNAPLHFKKKKHEEDSWKHEIMKHISGNSTKHVIPYLKLSNAVYNYFDKNKGPKMAEELFLVVNNKSVIDDEQKGSEVVEKKKTYIISFGKHSSRGMLTNLATDNRHIFVLGESDDSINGTAKSILNLSCQDSRLLCDTDKYWTEGRCYRCTYVCSPDAWKPSEYCFKTCPYFKHSPRDKDQEVDHSVNDPSGYKTTNNYSIANTCLLSVIIFVSVIIICWKCKPLKDKILNVCGNKNTSGTCSPSVSKYSTPTCEQGVYKRVGVNDGDAHVDDGSVHEVGGHAHVDDGNVGEDSIDAHVNDGNGRKVGDDAHEAQTLKKDDNLPATLQKFTSARREKQCSDDDDDITFNTLLPPPAEFGSIRNVRK